MGWKFIEIEEKCFIKTYNNNLIIFNDTKKIIPMTDIDVLMISNPAITISIAAVNELISSGVCLIMCNDKHLPHSLTYGYKVQKQSYVNFQKQLLWNESFKQSCWNWLVKIKINNQISFMDSLGLATCDIKNEFSEIDNFDNSLFEAKIANKFFKNVFKDNFNRKQDNIINSILNYGYIILTNMVARSIAKKGLNFNISFFHGSIYSAFPLAYDIVEIFRIIIDLFATKIFCEGIVDYKSNLTREIKSCLIDFIANYKIKIDDKYEFVNNAIDKVIDWIINGDFKKHMIDYDYDIGFINKEYYDHMVTKTNNGTKLNNEKLKE